MKDELDVIRKNIYKKYDKKGYYFNKIVLICLSISSLIFASGAFCSFIEETLGLKIMLVSFILIILLLLILSFFHLVSFSLRLFTSDKIFNRFISILLLIVFAIFISGIVIQVSNYSILNIYAVDDYVVHVKNKKAYINNKDNNHGDDSLIEIRKPFFVNLKDGEYIRVGYFDKKAEKFFYVFDNNVGMNMIIVSSILGFCIFLCYMFSSFIRTVYK